LINWNITCVHAAGAAAAAAANDDDDDDAPRDVIERYHDVIERSVKLSIFHVRCYHVIKLLHPGNFCSLKGSVCLRFLDFRGPIYKTSCDLS